MSGDASLRNGVHTTGCAAGAAATVVTYPLETLRTHMAVGGQSYRQCLSDVVKAHGHKGLYNGFASGLVCLQPLPLRSSL